MMAKVWTNEDAIICLSRKHCGKRRNRSWELHVTSNFSISHSVFKKLVLQTSKNNGLLAKGLIFFPNDQIFDLSKFTAFADDKLNMTQKYLKFAFKSILNIVGKGENAGYHHFLLFSQCFQKAFAWGSSKVGLCDKGLRPYLEEHGSCSLCVCHVRKTRLLIVLSLKKFKYFILHVQWNLTWIRL